MVLDVPIVLLQNNMPLNKDSKERVIMKIIVVLSDMRLELDS